MFHTVAWYESIDPAGALVPIAAVPDDTVSVSGDDIDVPEAMGHVIMQAVLGNDASLARGQFQSPSLRSVANIDCEPIVAALVFGSPPEGIFHPRSPVQLTPTEAVNCYVESDPAAAAVHYGLLTFADGPSQAIEGQIHTVRATAAASLSAGAWVNSALTFSQTLPVGRYRVVGFRARGTNLVAARLNFIGQFHRPGVPALNAIGDVDPWWTRYGRMGVFGEFHTNTPPSLDCLGVTDSAQVVLLDLIRTA